MQNQTTNSIYSNRGFSLEEIDLSLLKGLSLSVSRANRFLPLRVSDGKLVGLISGRNGVFALREMARQMELGYEPIKISEEELDEAINRAYGQTGSAEDVMESIAGEDLSKVATEFESPRDLLEITDDAPIIRLLNAILQQAVKERASDIHIEPYERGLDVRFRIDGILRKVLSPPKLIHDALITRVKILSNLDIAEKRLPQDGRIRVIIAGRDVDIRVSVVPTVFGERAVLRLLDRRQGMLGLDQVGLEEEAEEYLKELLSKTNGIILVTGPTGSGKTTTLYAALNIVKRDERNIITVEDPVEYQLEGVGQIQVNPKIGLTFAQGLRSILRQDPDVIMVGEIRDRETAEISIQASLTGHLVLSTLHTNDASTAVSRLLEMGIEPFLVSSSLMCVIAQRLVRTVCTGCKIKYEPSVREREIIERHGITVDALYKGSGCNNCNGTGYYGRTGLFEILNVTHSIRDLINKRADAHTIREKAVSEGMRLLREDGLMKAVKGITTMEEVLRVTSVTEDVPV